MTTREALAERVCSASGAWSRPGFRPTCSACWLETYIQIGDPQTADSLLQVSLGSHRAGRE